MRKRRARTTYIGLLAVCGAAALFAPTFPRLQSASAAVFAPVSHPAHAVGGVVTGWLEPAEPIDSASPDDPRAVARVYAENESLRQLLLAQTEQLERLKQINRDRDKLGTSIRNRCNPLRVVGLVEGEGDLLQVVGKAAAEGLIALHTQGSKGGIAGTVEADALGTARVRLISDRKHRPIGGAFWRFDSEKKELVELPVQPFLVSGLGEGRCAIVRHKEDDLKKAGVAPGDWAVLRDDDWPELLHGRRLAQVVAIEPIPDEAGFARVLMRPAADFTKVREVMVLTRP